MLPGILLKFGHLAIINDIHGRFSIAHVQFNHSALC